ncbi:hypothetical protein ACIGB6_15060 [Paeniglutamicibacter gangotriensis]|nr:hypothetical protein [Paeniglutamicibacter gangotriensis]
MVSLMRDQAGAEAVGEVLISALAPLSIVGAMTLSLYTGHLMFFATATRMPALVTHTRYSSSWLWNQTPQAGRCTMIA